MTIQQVGQIYQKVVKKNKINNPPQLVYSVKSDMIARYVPPRTIVFNGMLKLVTSDEVAVILSHELTHWMVEVNDTKWSNEQFADQQGTYLANRAGFNGCKGKIVFGLFREDEEHPPGYQRVNNIKCK